MGFNYFVIFKETTVNRFLYIINCFAAGADLIITNTYQASIDGFVEHLGVTADQAYELMSRAVELAKRARSLYLEEYEDSIQDGK